MPPYHRRAGKTGADALISHATGRRAVSKRKIAIRGGLAAVLVGGALLATDTIAGAAPAASPGVAPNARAAAERAIITHPDRDFMGYSARKDPQVTAVTPTVPKVNGGGLTSRQIAPAAVTAQTAGVDVSHWQGNTDWSYWWAHGRKFAWVKATEGTTYRDPSFNYQYTGSYNVGMIRGSYHFATPNTSSGAAQANFFADHGGGWSRDGRTLPGVLDIEYNPYGATCYGLSKTAMVNWIKDFTRQYKARTKRDAVIYSSLSWWVSCTGNSSAFAKTNPLWVPKYASAPGTLPSGWTFYTVWQKTDTPLDQDVFNGAVARLRALALG